MSGNVSTDYLAALQAYLEAPLVADRDSELGQRQAQMDHAAESLARVVKDPGASWLEINALRAMVADRPRQNESLVQALNAGIAQAAADDQPGA
jgi:hypothetical protein